MRKERYCIHATQIMVEPLLAQNEIVLVNMKLIDDGEKGDLRRTRALRRIREEYLMNLDWIGG